MFFARELPALEDRPASQVASTVTFSDGSIVLLDHWTGDPVVPISGSNVSTFAWWEHSQVASAAFSDEASLSSYHANVRLKHGEALLVDTGAPKNMCGDAWVRRAAEAAQPAGFGVTLQPLEKRMQVDGVGQSPSTCINSAIVPIALQGGEIAYYKANVINDSEVPALLGLESLEARRSVIDLVSGTLIELGPGPFQLNLPAGSKLRKLYKSPTGHLMLPCTEWDNAKPNTGKQLVFPADL
jgi:hypothetical protein